MGRLLPLATALLLIHSFETVGAQLRRSPSHNLDAFPANGEDLHTFVSRPDLRPPKFNIQIHNPELVSPGYWFVAPYEDLNLEPSSKLYTPAQIGPHIYDGNGELVWSGAHLFENSVTFDFKTSVYKGYPALTFILRPHRSRRKYPEGGGVILDSSLQIQNVLLQASGNLAPNMHEFTVTEHGTALMITTNVKDQSMPSKDDQANPDDDWIVRIADNGFREMRTESGISVFEWWALDHIHPFESFTHLPSKYSSTGWDWFHLNSIDMNQDGDFLISSRFTSAIYKISRKDGSIIWQLGGRHSSFTMIGFDFSSQHDARFQHENSSHTIISFLDNASNSFGNTSASSTALMVSLDLRKMTATPISKFERPDGGLSRLRGNVQALPNNNTFVCWSENSLISEFDNQGKLLLEASFASKRFVTYRAYKFNFTTTPTEQIALKSFVYGTKERRTGGITAMYASWNGATDVTSWRFHSWQPGGVSRLLGEVNRTGFETALMASGAHCKIYVEALSRQGDVLGKSEIVSSGLPLSWDETSCANLASNGPAYDNKPAKAHGLLGGNASTVTGMQLFVGGFIFMLVLSLGIAIWKIQKLNLQLRDGPKYEYTLLKKSSDGS